MEYTSTIVVIGGAGKGENPAKLHTQIEPVRLDKDMSMAITSISHGELYNVHSGNNKIYLNSTYVGMTPVDIPGSSNDYVLDEAGSLMLKIPVGRYSSASRLIKAIQSTIREHFGRNEDFGLDVDINAKNTVIKVTPSNLLIYVAEKLDSPWNLFGVSIDIQPNKLTEFENQDLLSNIVPALLYVNIVENSYINGKLSRNLALVPLSLKGGCSFYEFNHPNYVRIVVKDFSDLLLELRTLEGHYVPFNSSCNTAITLDLKPINRAAP